MLFVMNQVSAAPLKQNRGENSFQREVQVGADPVENTLVDAAIIGPRDNQGQTITVTDINECQFTMAAWTSPSVTSTLPTATDASNVFSATDPAPITLPSRVAVSGLSVVPDPKAVSTIPVAFASWSVPGIAGGIDSPDATPTPQLTTAITASPVAPSASGNLGPIIRSPTSIPSSLLVKGGASTQSSGSNGGSSTPTPSDPSSPSAGNGDGSTNTPAPGNVGGPTNIPSPTAPDSNYGTTRNVDHPTGLPAPVFINTAMPSIMSSSAPSSNDPTIPKPIPPLDSPLLPSSNSSQKFRRDRFLYRTPNGVSQWTRTEIRTSRFYKRTSTPKTSLKFDGGQGTPVFHNSIPTPRLQARQAPVPTTIVQGSNVCVVIPHSDPSTTSSDPSLLIGGLPLLTLDVAPTRSSALGAFPSLKQVINPDPGSTSMLSTVGPHPQIIAGNPATRVATAAAVTVTYYDSNGQPTATRTLNPSTSTAQSQVDSTIVSNDPVTTQTFYDASGRPTSTTIITAQLTTVTFYNSKDGAVQTKTVTVMGSSRPGGSNSSPSANPSASSGKQNTSSTLSSSTLITVLLDTPQTASPSSSPSKSAGSSITKSQFRVSFWVGILGAFIFAAWY
jgi:hypothetical protein